MRHITLITNSRNPLLPRAIATVTGNSFGDQIVEFKIHSTKILVDGKRTSGYVTVQTVRESEGSHMSDTEIKRYFKDRVKGLS